MFWWSFWYGYWRARSERTTAAGTDIAIPLDGEVVYETTVQWPDGRHRVRQGEATSPDEAPRPPRHLRVVK